MSSPRDDRLTTERRRSEAGFTLIELLVVISIIGILAGIAAFSFSAIRGKSVESACRSDYKSVELAQEAYRTKTGAYGLQADLTGATGTLRTFPTGSGYTLSTGTTGVITVSGTKVVGGSTVAGCNRS